MIKKNRIKCFIFLFLLFCGCDHSKNTENSIEVIKNFQQSLAQGDPFMKYFNGGFNRTRMGELTKKIIKAAMQAGELGYDKKKDYFYIKSPEKRYLGSEFVQKDGKAAIANLYEVEVTYEMNDPAGTEKIYLVKENGDWKIHGPTFYNSEFLQSILFPVGKKFKNLQSWDGYLFHSTKTDVSKIKIEKRRILNLYSDMNYENVTYNKIKGGASTFKEIQENYKENRHTIRRAFFHRIVSIQRNENKTSDVTCEYSVPEVRNGKMMGWKLEKRTIKLVKKNGKWLTDGGHLLKDDPVARSFLSNPDSFLKKH